jgi:hypothetical protein
MNLQEQINQAETRIFKTFSQILQITTILYLEQLFYDGRSSFITATRFTRKDVFLLTKLILPSPSQLELLSNL